MSRARTVATLACIVALAPIVLVALVGNRPASLTAGQHFGLVGGAAALTSLASLLLSLAGARARDGRAILMGSAFSTMTALFAIHALSTPGFLVGKNGMIALAGGLSVPVGVLILTLSALPALRRPADVRGLLALQLTLFAAIIALGVAGMLFPQDIPAVPKVGSTPANILFGIGGTGLIMLIGRAGRTFRLTRRAADLTVAVGCTWLGVTLYANLILGSGTFGFYSGHLLEILAVALVGLPAALDIKRAGASRPLVGDLTAPDLVAGEEAYLGPRVRALMVRLERRDVSTEEHTRRVALLAAQVGEQLKLSATARRHLAVGGLLHDIGKLSVPLEILNKPGKLTDEEFAAIKRHPGDGRRLLEELGGFPETVRGLVSDHHERLDGSGYPRGLKACELSLETRILAVVDVYDALVSDRVYRTAWSADRAFGLLEAEAHAYDQTVVAALKQVVAPFVADVSPAPVAQRVRTPRTA